MGVFRWICQNIFWREYPLISIPIFAKALVPYTTWHPTKICLYFSQGIKVFWQITDDNIAEITESILEHEYLHVVVRKVAGLKATHTLNHVNRFDLTTNRLVWMFIYPPKCEVFRDICRDGSRFNDDSNISVEYLS